jgi:heterodisulfide reductase subunit A-like polyferredoxin
VAYPSRSTSLLERLHHTAEHANGNGHFSGSQVKLQILVVGAGLGGLATAVALARQGHKVTVLEQAAVLGEVRLDIAKTQQLIDVYNLRLVQVSRSLRIRADCS